MRYLMIGLMRYLILAVLALIMIGLVFIAVNLALANDTQFGIDSCWGDPEACEKLTKEKIMWVGDLGMTENENYEIGFRGDGVVVWRKSWEDTDKIIAL